MRKRFRRLIKLCLLVALVFNLVIAGCNQLTTQDATVSTDPLLTDSQCRVIQHKLGEACIPAQPQRVVALDPRYILDHLLSLEINPIGYAAYPEGEKVYLVGISPEDVEDAEYVGSASQPSLEKIALLKPDLILTLNDQAYRQLLAIAPTVVIDYDEIKLSFKAIVRTEKREK